MVLLGLKQLKEYIDRSGKDELTKLELASVLSISLKSADRYISELRKYGVLKRVDGKYVVDKELFDFYLTLMEKGVGRELAKKLAEILGVDKGDGVLSGIVAGERAEKIRRQLEGFKDILIIAGSIGDLNEVYTIIRNRPELSKRVKMIYINLK
ncbi:MAG: hypothetical protein GXO26_07915 [Crenarchaeota archaeon]|nr:hypothetical protein [Thermoproteota archaeon]